MAGQEVTNHKCSVCSCEYTDDEGGVEGYFGMLPVTFCPTCFSCMCDMASQYIGDEDYTDSRREFLENIKGYQYIVINKCHGGFGLSREGKLKYLELTGIEYKLVPQPDRESQNLYGDKIVVNGREYWDRSIARDDPALVEVVTLLKNLANSGVSDLRVVKVPAGVDWIIEDYDGLEWVAESHRTWD